MKNQISLDFLAKQVIILKIFENLSNFRKNPYNFLLIYKSSLTKLIPQILIILKLSISLAIIFPLISDIQSRFYALFEVLFF